MATRDTAAAPLEAAPDSGIDGTSERVAEIVAQLREQKVILFVGAGVSAGLGLPTWQEFIGQLGGELGYEPDEFLALSNDFRSLTEFYRLEKASLEALCGKMSAEWSVTDEALASSAAHRLIVRLGFSTIYTTNYDDLLERAFLLEEKPFNKVVTARDIARSNPTAPTIIKFHGDLADPESMVLTESDYMRRLAFDDPLDIKLAADAFGKAVLFVGYSVSDINLRLLLYRLRGIWQASGCEPFRPRSYVLMTQANRVQQRILDSWGVEPLLATDPDETDGVAEFLQRVHAAALAASDEHARAPAAA